MPSTGCRKYVTGCTIHFVSSFFYKCQELNFDILQTAWWNSMHWMFQMCSITWMRYPAIESETKVALMLLGQTNLKIVYLFTMDSWLSNNCLLLTVIQPQKFCPRASTKVHRDFSLWIVLLPIILRYSHYMLVVLLFQVEELNSWTSLMKT